MTIVQLIEMLQSLPEESKNHPVLVQVETKDYSYTAPLDEIYCVKQNQYASEASGQVITHEEYSQLPDGEPNELLSVKRDFNLMCPAYTVFLYSEIAPVEPPTSKADLVKGTIIEGNIPHLRLERD